MTPDEWLLEQYDSKAARPHNHVRPILELIEDVPPHSSEDAPALLGAAQWPEPFLYADLDWQGEQASQRTHVA